MTPRARPLRLSLAVALALAALLVLAGGVAAHAELVDGSPAAESTVDGTPSEIVATFSEALETEGTSFTLRDAGGQDIATGAIDPDDETRLVMDDLPELAPGEYEVLWVAASDDGHIERDTWTFTVEAAATPAPTPASSPSPTATVTDQPSASPSSAPASQPAASPSAAPADPDPASSTSDILIPIIVLVALVGTGMAYFLRRRRGPAA